MDEAVRRIETPVSTGFCAAPSQSRDKALRRMVERLVIPRLALQTPSVVRPERFGDGLSQEVPSLTRLALDTDGPRSRRILHRLYEAGATFSELQLGLLAPSAKRLGRMWLADEVTFVDVTIAAGHLQHLMRFVALELAAGGGAPQQDRTILVAPAPGEDHVFGAAMAAEFFRRDGWSVAHDPRPSAESLAAHLAANRTDVLGLSVVSKPDAPALRRAIAACRAASANPDLLVIAGGEAMAADPLLVSEIGADATLAALSTAPARAHRLTSALLGARRRSAAG